MKSTYVAAVVGAAAAIASFMLTRVIWPDPAGAPMPPANLMPFFIGLSVLESLIFGVGVAFFIMGLARMRGRSSLAWAAFLSVVWSLVSWWPHDNLHRINPESNMAGLLRIEYGFHVTLMIAGAIIAYWLWRNWRAA